MRGSVFPLVLTLGKPGGPYRRTEGAYRLFRNWIRSIVSNRVGMAASSCTDGYRIMLKTG